MVTIMNESSRDGSPLNSDDMISNTKMDKDHIDMSSILPEVMARTHMRLSNGTYVRQNHVGSVILQGVPIVSLFIDQKERLCLAQISNTLLKNYSYNEIHNRRVALGITCVQCTPVQLEILRRAGAMPISSRRCGMITLREAERLVKSFLEDNSPPKLPDNFRFDVKHECGWGCTGQFEPSRYNSSRAKCIKCTVCNAYFSPNKFIFHFHRTAESKYSHPDAANFNSWRRHLKLCDASEKDDTTCAWEDVKAMFNGGNRKRIMSSSHGSTSRVLPSKAEPSEKKSRLRLGECVVNKPMYPSPYSPFPLLSLPGKPYQFGQLNHSPPFSLGLPFNKESSIDSTKAASLQSASWGIHGVLPTYNMLWNTQMGAHHRNGIRGTMYPFKETHNQDTVDMFENGNDNELSSPDHSPSYNNSDGERFSAFRLVKKSDDQIDSARNSDRDDEDSEGEIDITDEGRDDDKEEADAILHQETSSEDEKNDNFPSPAGSGYSERDCRLMCSPKCTDTKEPTEDMMEKQETSNEDDNTTKTLNPYCENRDESASETEIGCNDGETDDIVKTTAADDVNLSKELQLKLRKEIDTRKKIEKDIELMKETFKGEVDREHSYREGVAQQLQIVKDTLTNELEQERQVRFSLQQKLKEAHDALHNFSCKMLASRQCDECTFKEGEIPRQ
ncbi:SKI family transcriptional corepressor 1-like isoform X2 [Mizuhopecten yessoensis]|uniref:SKI family transcriptional corepressor 1-like isoform X2 n=1 Tax=Mizuhopecten yessoensis TaxID=6573 RepID=UPI000B45F7FD|nr:SKI family transcriptional corepressor 1-like isoform X2 [Mizuhopecten yessoensis]